VNRVATKWEKKCFKFSKFCPEPYAYFSVVYHQQKVTAIMVVWGSVVSSPSRPQTYFRAFFSPEIASRYTVLLIIIFP